MRTIASTFSSWGEAEAASRRLHAIGVAPDGIKLRDSADAGGAERSGGGPGSGAVVLSAKVAPDQVEEATRILSGGPEEVAMGVAAASTAAPEAGHVYFGGPEEVASRPVRAPAPAREPAAAPAAEGDREWWGPVIRKSIIAILVAFAVGAVLGWIAPG